MRNQTCSSKASLRFTARFRFAGDSRVRLCSPCFYFIFCLIFKYDLWCRTVWNLTFAKLSIYVVFKSTCSFPTGLSWCISQRNPTNFQISVYFFLFFLCFFLIIAYSHTLLIFYISGISKNLTFSKCGRQCSYPMTWINFFSYCFLVLYSKKHFKTKPIYPFRINLKA